MIQLITRSLNKPEQDVVDNLQKSINDKVTFVEKVDLAQTLWDNKGGMKGKAAFRVIESLLLDMCVFVRVCNYCEQSEANDIEHIYPKSFFPEHTFNWENYILACKQCNSGHKLDKGYVLDTNDDLVKLKRGEAPPFSHIAFINIRLEDPNTFMILNPLTYKFDVFTDLNKADSNKAWATIDILELNTRDTLLAARKSAARHYYEMLDRLIRILKVSTKEEFEDTLSPLDDLFDMQESLENLKANVTSSFKKYISTYQHPSVWHLIKTVESKTNPKWVYLFKQLPEALHW